MSQIKVFFKDTFTQQLELDPQQIYFAGRGESCHILMNPEKGISRQHLRIFFADAQWNVEVLSKIGEVFFQGQKVLNFKLQSGERFDAPPYSFIFLDEENSVVRQSTVTGSLNNSSETKMSQFSLAPDEEKTFLGQLPQIALLRLSDPHSDKQQTFRLEGEAWVAGRDTTCNLFVDHPHLSRRQFEIQKNDNQFCIINLSSVNQTLLNGSELPSDQWTVLSSGDIISIVDIDLHFELRDALFDKKIKEINPSLYSPVILEDLSTIEKDNILKPLTGAEENYSNKLKSNPDGIYSTVNHSANDLGIKNKLAKSKQSNLIKISIGMLILAVLVYFILIEEEPKKPSSVDTQISKNYDPKFERLTPEQKNYINDSYRLADSLFRQGKYELSRQETIKIHQLIDHYEESKNIEKLAEVAIQTQIEKNRAESIENEKRIAEQKIIQQVAYCKTKVNVNIEMEDVDLCLSSVISLNPEHPSIISFKNEIDRMISIREIKQSEKEAYDLRVARQKALYEKAQRIAKSENYLQAIRALQDVIDAKLPDPKGFKIQASRQLASLKSEMSIKLNEYIKESEHYKQKGDLKSAILELRKALVFNQDNKELKNKEKSILLELKKQMQVFYQEGILEESIGEIETAKSKWKKIISSSLSDEEYYIKATIKLKKYEAQ